MEAGPKKWESSLEVSAAARKAKTAGTTPQKG
jgi:hypothetical protein